MRLPSQGILLNEGATVTKDFRINSDDEENEDVDQSQYRRENTRAKITKTSQRKRQLQKKFLAQIQRRILQSYKFDDQKSTL